MLKKEKLLGSLITARTDYAMNGGERMLWTGAGRFKTVPLPEFMGTWVVLRRVGAKHILDGLSQTYLVGEKFMLPDLYDSGLEFADWGGIIGLSTSHNVMSYVRSVAARIPVTRDRDHCFSSCHDFGAAHVAGWNVAMADGSVQSIDYGQSNRVHRSLATIQGDDQFATEP